MNRYLSIPLTRFFLPLLALLCVLSLTPSASSAQTGLRQFPPAALRGTLQVTQPPEVLINGAPARLSPGARIKGVSNLLVMSGTLVGQHVLVNYVRDTQGMIHEVWILSEQEALQKRKGMEPTFNFSFGSDADKPKTDDGKTPFDQLPRYSPQ